jgi:hypothetical protein
LSEGCAAHALRPIHWRQIIATQANVGFGGDCGRSWSTLETTRMTDSVEKLTG